jgi:hypothetical protein
MGCWDHGHASLGKSSAVGVVRRRPREDGWRARLGDESWAVDSTGNDQD